MSSGDAVCTGWLVKSPPERKLQRYAWRKRWFVLRRGRMSGNPDVLEYYRNKHSSKPIRVIDLSECTVWKHSGPGFVRKEFQNNFVFIVKTTSRTFYLVAKTEAEMQAWVYSITQVCNFGHLEGGAADSMESLSHTPCSLQPSSASSLHTAHAVSSSLPRDDPNSNTVATEETRSESEFPLLPDYLILSNCETGRLHHASLPTRCDSWSNSDRSLEQTSSDDVFVDGLQSLHYVNLADPLTRRNGSQEVPYYARPRNGSQEVPYYARPRNGSQEVPYYARPRNGSQEVPYYARPRNGSQEVPYYARPRTSLICNRDSNGPYRDHVSSPLLETSLNSTIQVDKNQGSLPYGATTLDLVPNVPPPRPPKPIHLSERRQEERLQWSGHSSIKKPECTTAPRRISLSGLDNMRPWKADVEGQSLRQRDKRHSLNLPCRSSPMCPTASTSDEDSYVPMAPLGAISCLKTESNSDDYIPMSSGSFSSPLPELPANLEPPPVNRDLKPQRKPRSPPLDPRNLSTIREHASLTRTHTVPCNRTSFLSPERNGINSARFFASSVSREEKESNTQMGQHQTVNSRSSGALIRTKKCNLDYLALDFNSASPAPVQQKLLSEEHKVDYVQVDEQKTQALQNTKQEWTDERQSKVF